MKKNIGTNDRIFRAVLAVMILLFSIWQSSWLAFAISLFVFYEAIAGWCLFYQLIGKNSCPTEPHDKK